MRGVTAGSEAGPGAKRPFRGVRANSELEELKVLSRDVDGDVPDGDRPD